jgi:hypothetical protein
MSSYLPKKKKKVIILFGSPPSPTKENVGMILENEKGVKYK